MAGEAAALQNFIISAGFAIDQPSAKKAVKDHAAVQRTMTDDEKKQVAEREKVELEAAKRSKERRKGVVKEAEQAVLQAEAFSIKALSAISATAFGITLAVDKAAAAYERLGYAAKRSGASAAGVTSFAYAASQLGGSADAAQSQLVGFGQLMKSPGMRQALGRLLGKNIQGESSDNLATDLGDRLRRMQADGPNGYQRAIAFGGQYGFDATQTQALMDPRYRQFEAERLTQLKETGANPDAAAATGAAFEQSSRHLQSAIDDVWMRISTDLQQKIGPQLDALADAIAKHAPEITAFVTTLATEFSDLVTAFSKSQGLKDAMKVVGDAFDEISKYIGTDDFKKSIHTTVDEIDRIAIALHKFHDNLVKWGLIHDDANPNNPATDVSAGEAAGGGYGMGGGGGKGMSGPDAHRPSRDGNNSGERNWWTPDRQALAYKKLRDGGLSDLGARALVSRWKNVESAGGPSSSNNLGGGHFGIAQWGGARRPGVPADFEGQLDYVVKELNSNEAEAKRRLNSATNEEEAGAAASSYERAEGWNGRSDNFAGRTAAGMGSVVTSMPVPPTAVPALAKRGQLPSGAMYWSHDAAGNPVAVDAQGNAVNPNGSRTTVGRPLGDTPALQTSIANSNKGDTNQSQTNNFNIHGGDPKVTLDVAKRSAGRGWMDLMRQSQVSED